MSGWESTQQRNSMASRFSNSPVITRLRNSQVVSAAKQWAAGKASPKPQPRDPNPRRFFNNQQTTVPPNNSIPNNGENLINNNKVAKFARNASPRLKKMGEGFLEAVKGAWSALMDSKFRKDYLIFLKSMSLTLLAINVLFSFFLLIYWPIISFALSWLPGLSGQVLTLMPLWAYIITRKRTPMASNRLFLDELEKLSSSRAEELEQQMNVNEAINNNWMEEVYHDLRTSWHFTKYSLMSLAFSIVPIVGPFITFLGQTWLVADRMGWNLLSVYTISAKKMSYRQQKHWMRARKWRIIGFTLPYILLASIPFIGPLFLGIAEAATAHIYFHLLSKDTDSLTDKKKPSPGVEFKKAT